MLKNVTSQFEYSVCYDGHKYQTKQQFENPEKYKLK